MPSTFTLVLNSNNVVANSNNTLFRYNFLNGAFRVEEDSLMAISSVVVPYSFFNISQAYGNNTFSFTFPDSVSTTTSYSVTIPDGFYTTSTINSYLQQFCITNGLYLINASGQYVYYIVFTLNTNSYANEILFFKVPTSLPSGYSAPTAWHGYPVSTFCPTLTISATTGISNFGVFLGLSAGTYGGTASDNSKLSNIVPIGTLVNAITIRSNIVNNNIAMPSDLITSIPINATFGSNITYSPTFEQFVNIKAGVYNNLTVSLTDQNFATIFAKDPNVIITLIIKNK
jgi:hypothetical protein